MSIKKTRAHDVCWF